MGDHDDLPLLATKVSENVNFQRNSDLNLSKGPSDGFVDVKRKQKNYRQFFLSRISKDVNDSQIASYLAKRNVIASHISLFPSKRLGTISVKEQNFQEQNFWPKFACCKPWQHKDNMKPVVPASNNNRQGRNYATNDLFNIPVRITYHSRGRLDGIIHAISKNSTNIFPPTKQQ